MDSRSETMGMTRYTNINLEQINALGLSKHRFSIPFLSFVIILPNVQSLHYSTDDNQNMDKR
jgi:hypothetical protein